MGLFLYNCVQTKFDAWFFWSHLSQQVSSCSDHSPDQRLRMKTRLHELCWLWWACFAIRPGAGWDGFKGRCLWLIATLGGCGFSNLRRFPRVSRASNSLGAGARGLWWGDCGAQRMWRRPVASPPCRRPKPEAEPRTRSGVPRCVGRGTGLVPAAGGGTNWFKNARIAVGKPCVRSKGPQVT